VVAVHQLLESSNCMSPTPQMMADLQSLACALLESLNDKNVALSHQRKTNKSVTSVYALHGDSSYVLAGCQLSAIHIATENL